MNPQLAAFNEAHPDILTTISNTNPPPTPHAWMENWTGRVGLSWTDLMALGRHGHLQSLEFQRPSNHYTGASHAGLFCSVCRSLTIVHLWTLLSHVHCLGQGGRYHYSLSVWDLPDDRENRRAVVMTRNNMGSAAQFWMWVGLVQSNLPLNSTSCLISPRAVLHGAGMDIVARPPDVVRTFNKTLRMDPCFESLEASLQLSGLGPISSSATLNDLLIRMIRMNILPPSKLGSVLETWDLCMTRRERPTLQLLVRCYLACCPGPLIGADQRHDALHKLVRQSAHESLTSMMLQETQEPADGDAAEQPEREVREVGTA